MKQFFTSLLALYVMCAAGTICHAQDMSPVEPLNKINDAISKMSQKYIEYMSAMAHTNNEKKTEKKFNALLSQVEDSRYEILDAPYYKGDKTLNQQALDYIKLVNNLLNENYAKMVNMEEIAEQSYDKMEAYILLKKKVKEKMDEAGEKNHQAVVDYCKKYNITLTEAKNELDSKMDQLNAMTDYYDEIHLIFFKCSVQEDDMMEAVNKKNITTVEQLKNSISKFANEGLTRLDTLQDFKGNAMLKNACRNALKFFQDEAAKMSIFTDYLIKEQAFEKIKSNFESNPSASNDKQEIDKYNKAVKEINDALKQYNQTNDNLNQARTNMYNNWNTSVQTFMDAYAPYAD